MAGPGNRLDAMLRVSEVYASIQGESTLAGWPCVIVRLAGCPFRCVYCDTPSSLDERDGREMTLREIVASVAELGIPLVEVTGGEPLTQEPTKDLLREMLDRGLRVLLETGGGVSIEGVDARARIILDVKTPDSGMHDKQVWENLERLKPEDEIKIVLCSRADYVWARELVRTRRLTEKCVVQFSPVEMRTARSASASGISKQDLAKWILEDRLPVRLNLQLHVWIWGAGTPGV
jgi:7-carboxy-7-deazaguanine synthase